MPGLSAPSRVSTYVKFFIATVAVAASPLAAEAALNSHLTLTLNGTVIEGDSTMTTLGRENTIECLSFSQAGFSDTSRLPPIKRSYRPITLRKRIDRATPLLIRAWAQGHNNGSAVFRFYRRNPDNGSTEHYYTIQLVNPQIVAVSTSGPDTLDPDTASLPDLETVSFIFEQIIYTDEVNGTSFTDNPSGL